MGCELGLASIFIQLLIAVKGGRDINRQPGLTEFDGFLS